MFLDGPFIDMGRKVMKKYFVAIKKWARPHKNAMLTMDFEDIEKKFTIHVKLSYRLPKKIVLSCYMHTL